MKNLFDIFTTIDKYQNYLINNGISLNKNGFPLLDKEMFLNQWPDFIVPINHRKNHLIYPKKTLICFYCKDELIYPKIDKIFTEIQEYKQYMGIISSDITITKDMDIEWQRLILQLNFLFTAILAINGIKIVINTRSADSSNLDYFNFLPKNIMYASGFLGCKNTTHYYETAYLDKILTLLPSKLIIYGEKDKITLNQLDTLGINYKVYPDFHSLSKKLYKQKQINFNKEITNA